MGLFVTALLTGCISNDIVTEDFSGEYNTNDNTTLIVKNSNGDIRITTYEGDTVKLDAEKRVSENHKDELDKTEINVTEVDNEIVIETIYEEPSKTHATVNMVLKVPEYVNVESVRSSNGDITVRNVKGYPTVSSSNGDVDMRGTTGISEVSSSNGDVTVEVFSLKEDVSISSSNGDVVVYILLSLNATIDMQTSNGRALVSGLSLDTTLDEDKHITGTMNGGGHKVEIHSSNGDVELKKLTA
jgi:hypothetical protein